MVKLNLTAPRASVPVAESDLVEAACEALQASEFIRQEFKDLDEMIQVQDNLIHVKDAIGKSDDVHNTIKLLDIVEGMESLFGVAESKLTKEAAVEGLGQKIIDGFKAAIKKIRDFFMRIYNWIKSKFTKKQTDVTVAKAEEVAKAAAAPEVKKATPEKVAATPVNDKSVQASTKRVVRGSFATLGEALDMLNIQAPAGAGGAAPAGNVNASMEGLSDAIHGIDDSNRVDSYKADVELPAVASIQTIILKAAENLLSVVKTRVGMFSQAFLETDPAKFSKIVSDLNSTQDALKQIMRDTENKVEGFAEARVVNRKEGDTVTLGMLGIKTTIDLEKFCNTVRENAKYFRDTLFRDYIKIEDDLNKLIETTKIPEDDDVGMLRQKIELMRRLAKFSHKLTDTAYGIRSEIDDVVNMMNSVIKRFKSQVGED